MFLRLKSTELSWVFEMFILTKVTIMHWKLLN